MILALAALALAYLGYQNYRRNYELEAWREFDTMAHNGFENQPRITKIRPR